MTDCSEMRSLLEGVLPDVAELSRLFRGHPERPGHSPVPGSPTSFNGTDRAASVGHRWSPSSRPCRQPVVPSRCTNGHRHRPRLVHHPASLW
jgi:hypothetical protein